MISILWLQDKQAVAEALSWGWSMSTDSGLGIGIRQTSLQAVEPNTKQEQEQL